MKTTLDLPEDLLMEAKTVAIRRRTTLKAIFESALRRELRPASEMENPDPEKYELGPFGILSLKNTGSKMTAEEVKYLIDHHYDEEDARTLAIAKGRP
jgi:hypothetical protein